MVSLKSTTTGTEYFDFSNDGTLWDTFPVSGFAVAANVHEFHNAVKGKRYFRVRFENGSSSITTSFRIHTYYGVFRLGVLPLNQSIGSDADAMVVRSVIAGEDPAGTFSNVRANGYVFQTISTLTANSSYTSSVYSTSGFSQLQTELYASHSGTLVGYWYTDSAGTNLIRTFTRPYSTSDAGNYVYFSAPVFGPYVKYVYTNGSTKQTSFYLGLKFLINSVSGQVLGTSDFISSTMVANLGRNIIVGQTDGGQFVNVPVTSEGHLEIALHDPLLPFGSIHTENMRAIFQHDAVYGINASQSSTVTYLSGTVTSSNNLFQVSTGTTQFGYGVFESRKRLRYRPGQGLICRFTGLFSAPVANSYQIIGIGHAEDGFYFGYGNTNNLSDTSFGILYVRNGVRETRTLTITTASSTTQNVTVTLNGVAFTVAVTNSGNIQRTVYEISRGTYFGWSAYPSGATIVFVRGSAGSASGTYSLTATTAVGTFAQTKAGVASTDTFIPQSSWNGEKLDGTGNSGITFDPTKGNVFQIGIQYLGFGVITFKIETAFSGNNAAWTTVHTINNPNTLTTPILSNPSFPFTLASYSAGSTSNLTVSTASYAGFLEGNKMLHGNRFSYTRSLTTVAATPTIYALLTILNKRYYNGKSNQSVVNLLSVQFAMRNANSGGSLYLIKNATLVGNPNFTDYDTNSCTSIDTSATTCTYSTNSQILWTGILAETGAINHLFTEEDTEVTLQPGEYLTICGNTTSGTAAIFAGTINTREDQ
jgi:hypothetical protein